MPQQDQPQRLEDEPALNPLAAQDDLTHGESTAPSSGSNGLATTKHDASGGGMGWPLPGEYGHAWTAPAGAGYGAMATVAGVRVPLGERRKTYDDEVLLSRVNTRRSPGDEGLGGEEGASGEGAAAIEVEEAQPAPVMLKSRASSGELGLLFDQAIRNAENQAEEQLRSGTAMGRSTSSPPRQEPHNLRPPPRRLADPDPSSSGSSLALPPSNQSSESFRNGATPDTSLGGSINGFPPSEPYGFGNQQSFYPSPYRQSPPFGYPQRSNSGSSESPYPYYGQHQFGAPNQYPHPSHDPNIFALDPNGSPYSQLASPHSQLASLPLHSINSPPPSEHFYPSHPYGPSPSFSDQVPPSPSQYYASPPPPDPNHPPPHLPPSHRANQFAPSQHGIDQQQYGVDPSLDSSPGFEQSMSRTEVGGQVYGSDGSPATSPHPQQQAYPPTQLHGQPPAFQQPYSSMQGMYPSQGAYPPYLQHQQNFPYPPSCYPAPSDYAVGPPFAYPVESPYVPYPPPQFQQPAFQNSPYRPVVFQPLHHHQQQRQQQPSRFPAQSTSTPPKPYAPPVELARGHLAQAKLRDAVFDRESPYPLGERRRSSAGARSALPKPPPHSPHALWVGNVPSDATHAELWRFFSSRPVPASSPTYADLLVEGATEADLHSTGVESIHLIARSNCAFVNYASDIHLQHSIAVSHAHSLRPFDPRCKELVCRVRKRDDDTKSGVGAQRTGGMHHAYVAKMELERREKEKREGGAVGSEVARRGSLEPSERERERESGVGQQQHRESTGSTTTRSYSNASTSSSFLGRHFSKRFFILKAMSEEDLKLSVERSLWVTQSHNEPVLDQAFRTCREGVFLIFGANKTGEFYGYAKMAGPISHSKRSQSSSHDSPSHEGSGSQSDAQSLRAQTIPEDEPTAFTSLYPRPPLFSPSEHRLADASPLPLTPSSAPRGERGSSAPAQLTPARSAQLDEPGLTVAENLHIPLEKQGHSLDSKLAKVMGEMKMGDKAVLEQQAVGASDVSPVQDEDGVWRKDTLPTAEERNARLEKMDEGVEVPEQQQHGAGWGKPFKLEWIKVARLPFTRTRHIKNAFNSNKEVKISRDGTELEPAAGELLVDEFWRDEEGSPEANAAASNAPRQEQAVPSSIVGS